MEALLGWRPERGLGDILDRVVSTMGQDASLVAWDRPGTPWRAPYSEARRLPERQSTVWTRAASSSGEKGLMM